jgi:hypothetical protein
VHTCLLQSHEFQQSLALCITHRIQGTIWYDPFQFLYQYNFEQEFELQENKCNPKRKDCYNSWDSKGLLTSNKPNSVITTNKSNGSSETPLATLSNTTATIGTKLQVKKNNSTNKNNNNNNNNKSPSTAAATATTTTTNTQPQPTKTPTTIPKKKAPPPEGMDVSPSARARKPKVTNTKGTSTGSGRNSPNVLPTATATTITTVKVAPPSNNNDNKAPIVAKTTATPTSNNNNNNLGLSELSKQLRLQRAKNEWQHNEIARLERQLRILSDLKGVSVADLRFSLQNACQQEAYGELRNQVQSLQAQLDALQMQRDNTRRRGSTATSEATESKIATLQLRIGLVNWKKSIMPNR